VHQAKTVDQKRARIRGPHTKQTAHFEVAFSPEVAALAKCATAAGSDGWLQDMP